MLKLIECIFSLIRRTHNVWYEKYVTHLLANFVLLSAKEFSVNDHDLKNKGIDVKFDIDLLIWIELARAGLRPAPARSVLVQGVGRVWYKVWQGMVQGLTKYTDLYGTYTELYWTYTDLYGAYIEIYGTYAELYGTYTELNGTYTDLYGTYTDL